MSAAHTAVASACIFASVLLASSLTLRDSDPEWDAWLQAAHHEPSWLKEFDMARAQRASRKMRGPNLRVAVLCSGVLKRFFLQETASGLVGPLNREGHNVDMYLALNIANFTSFRPGANTLKPDPLFKDKKASTVKDMITDAVHGAGGRVKMVDLFDGIEKTDQDRKWLRQPGNMMRGKENVLKKLKPLEALYYEAVKQETQQGQQYDFMIFLDDDTIWLRPFSLTQLLQATQQHKERQLFTQLCGPNSTTITPETGFLTEYIFVANRSVADKFGQQYTKLTTTNLGRKVWNLEEFSWRVMRMSNAVNIQVSPAAIPMQRGGRFNNSGPLGVCLHKKCIPKPYSEDPLRGSFQRMDIFANHHVCKEALWK